MSTEGKLFFTDQDVRRLRSNARASRFHSLWMKVLDGANVEVQGNTSKDRAVLWAKHLLPLALVHLVEGDDRYAFTGKKLLLMLTSSETFTSWMDPFHKRQHPTMVSDLNTAEVAVSSILACEAFIDTLTADERKQIKSALLTRAVEPILSDTERDIWWSSAYNSNWCTVMYSALGLAALYLNSSRTLELATEKVRKALDATGPEGEGVEGVGYWLYNFSSASLFVEALSRSGQQVLKTHPFWQKALNFPLSFLMPDFKGWVPFFDTPYIGFGREHFFYWLAGCLWDLGDEDQAEKAQWLGDKIVVEHRQEADLMDLLWRRDEIEPRSPEGSSFKLFPLIHTAALKTGRDKQSSLFVFKGGSNDSPHRHLDLASVILAIGEDRLLIEPGKGEYCFRYWTSVTPPVSTAWHNTVVVDGANQRDPHTFFGDENRRQQMLSTCQVQEFLQNHSVGLLSADATSAYSDQLRYFQRHVFWLYDKEILSPSFIVLMDDIKAKDLKIKRDFALHYHTPCDVEILDQAGVALIRGKQSYLLVQILASSDCFLETSEPTQIGGTVLRRLAAHAYWILRHPDVEETAKVQFVTLLIPFTPNGCKPEICVQKEPELLAAKVRKEKESVTLLFSRGRTSKEVEVFGLTTDAHGCLVCEDNQGLKSILVLKGSQVTFKGQSVFSATEQQSYCWTRISKE